MREVLKRLAPVWLTALYKNIHRAGRMLSVRQDDVFIVSYPKSGNTWTRFLIANMLYGEGASFSNMEKLVPSIYANSDKRLLALPSPRFIKSHESFDPRYQKVILIVRDPRDVAVSYFHYLKKFRLVSDDMDIKHFVVPFIKGEFDNFGSWGENLGSWLGARGGDESLLILRYEDMLADARGALVTIATFIGIAADEGKIDMAVKNSSFESMRELEQTQKPWRAVRHERQDIPFIRSGQAGGWKNVLSDDAAALIEEKWRTLMERFGYI